jgi:hypothetical protein
MTNTVVIQSVTKIGDAVTVVGTVNGQVTQCQVWQSELNTFPSILSQQNYLAQQLVASLPPTPIPLPSLIPPGPVTV